MCTIGKQLKFCSCSVDNLKNLEHYWILYRAKNRENAQQLVGELMASEIWNWTTIERTKTLLKRNLNKPDAFDRDLDFQNGDYLLIQINNIKSEKEQWSFYFEFEDGKWQEVMFPEINKYRKIAVGKVEKIN